MQEIGLESHFPILWIWEITLVARALQPNLSFRMNFLLISSAVAFFKCVSCPEDPQSIPLLCQPRLSLLSSLLAPHFIFPCTVEAHQVFPSCASGGRCLLWCIITEPHEHCPTCSTSPSNFHTWCQHIPSEQVNDPAFKETLFLSNSTVSNTNLTIFHTFR